MACFFGHDWTDWETYERSFDFVPFANPTQRIPMQEWRQKRRCEECGYVQDEKIRDGGKP